MSIHPLIRGTALQLMAVALLAASAAGDIVATDDFSYPDGSLYGASGGAGWTSFWTGSGMDVAEGAAISNVAGNPPKYGSRAFVNPESEPGLFFRIDLALPAFTLADYFVVAGGLGVNIGQISFGKFAGSNQLQVGNGGLTAGGPELVPNTSLQLIGAYVKGSGAPGDRLMLWINPDGDDYFDIATSAHSADIFRFDFAPYHSHQVTMAASTPGARFDNLVISNSPGGVGLGSAAVPEPANAAIAAVGLAAGCLVRLRRRRL